MPKKRHQAKYSKPQSTAPHSLESTRQRDRQQQQQEPHARSVNDLLASLRRTNLGPSSAHPDAAAPAAHAVSHLSAPSVPPTIAHILQLPETPAPAPRRAAGLRLDARGRRLPPGPAPPRSWLAQSRHAPERRQDGRGGGEGGEGVAARAGPRTGGEADNLFDAAHDYGRLPGAYLPARGSLIDMLLRSMALNWEAQRQYDYYYLSSLPGHLRAALIAYLGVWQVGGVSMGDLRALLLPPPPLPDDEDGGDDGGDAGGDDGAVVEASAASHGSPSALNDNVRSLDLTGSVGYSLRIWELSSLLFPSATAAAHSTSLGGALLQESWDEAPETAAPIPSLPRPLLPNLTHLSLAVNPGQAASGAAASTVSWRHLLSLAAHLPTLTHLSLAYWPEPCLTPNAKFAAVVSNGGGGAGRAVQYGGTGPYSHSLDGDWSEAVAVLRRLGKALYGLEHLDLTGCAAWFPALTNRVETDVDGSPAAAALEVDWVGDWGKISTLVLRAGRGASRDDVVAAVSAAVTTERHVRARRAGRGRIITVERDTIPE